MSLVERAEALARTVASLADVRMRVDYVRHELSLLDPMGAVDLLAVVAARAEARDPSHASLLLSISVALADPVVEPLRQTLHAAASTRGHLDLARLLARESTGPAADASSKNAQVPDFGRGRPLTLGERKALARTHDRNLILRVIRDPHPDVIAVLLANPSLTESDVVRLCARRPVAAEVLREVFRATKWVVRYGVRRALVKNPYCPLDVALQLAAHLNAQDARAAADSPELPDELRDACRRIAGEVVIH
jgi:hypothetical protein